MYMQTSGEVHAVKQRHCCAVETTLSTVLQYLW